MSKPILCLDFDGVIHSYTSGWKGADVVSDPPVPGAIAFMREALESFRVAIFSSRSNQPGGIEAMARYVRREAEAEKLDGPWFDHIEWPTEKPPAMVSIDDRALTFDGVYPTVGRLLAFKPWNKT